MAEEAKPKEGDPTSHPVEEQEDDGFGDRLPGISDEEDYQVTVRAIAIGCLLGAIVGASNMYLGLKTGFTFGPALFGAIIGFSILKPLSRVLPPAFGGGHFGPKENCTVQTAATAAGGLGIIFVSAVPALYKLGLMGESPKKDIGRLILLTLISAYYGLFFAVPLRKYFVIKQKLIFPTPTASAHTIRSLHDGVSGEAVGKSKAKVMVICFTCAIIWTLAGYFAPGVFRDWHIAYWFYSWGWKPAIQAENWHWILQWTPAFIGAGMLSGLNVSASMWLGSFLAWGVIGPILISNGKAVGKDTKYPDQVNYFRSITEDPLNAPSPRYWMLWPGVMLMVCTSFAELLWNWKTIGLGLRNTFADIWNTVTRKRSEAALDVQMDDEDPTLPSENIPTVVWTGGVLLSAVFTIVILNQSFNVGVGEGILSIVLAFLFAFIGLQAAGQTDINPVSAVAKTSQLVFGGVSKGKGMTEGTQLLDAQRMNLIGGAVAAAAAAQSVDMVGDLKTGYLLRATPRGQFIAQIFGAFVSVFISVGLFILYTQAYPCIIRTQEEDKLHDECEFAMPSVGAWSAVAQALTDKDPTIPHSSGYTAIGLGVTAVVSVWIKNSMPEKYQHYVPNFNAIGIAFVLESTVYSNAMLIGAVIAHIWVKRWPASWEMAGYAVASGLIAGEGLSGLLQAILNIADLGGEKVGTGFMCPHREYCG
ncbi:OPT superfamily oligopeptide transporter [Spizellomyces punctatus DAOM BR117]|uniref:OPT superfamily oligopeptide transporter n=1 Tax=Spizellomyces punctatus (strain DAOM BR117) TaxID=645134 RepID=A0A0L0HFA3_SPIPD|nr:OPT superfamily oligopeptide transporter [Spizellomyces punctatus DAOM BR117]KNC99802.1 OPT superfamily oligopeptide transporter [Spizellomyces punctatus DAOM BR117]|eukprot:XP_016607842.1 OPT superfamily oligopeptide transporter [Spizellomyces punctatus DAOM BR117]